MKTSQHRRRWPNIYQTLGRGRLALPNPQHVLTSHICVLHITGCEDIKTVAQLIEAKDDLVTVDHLPGSKS